MNSFIRFIVLLIVVFFLMASVFAQCASVSPYTNKVCHIVWIIQENRSFDHYFGHFPGVVGYPVTTGTSNGSPITLVHANPNISDDDAPHIHTASVNNINGGLMDGFNTTSATNCDTGGTHCSGYTYFDGSDIPFYYDMARRFGLADNHFSTISGWSYPNHLVMYTGQHTPIADDIQNSGATSANNDWTCFSATSSGSECTSGTAPCRYVSDANSHALFVKEIPITGSPTAYQNGLCGGTCGAGGAYCRNLSDCGSCTADGVSQGAACTVNGDCTGNGTGATCQYTRANGGGVDSICPNVTSIFAELTAGSISHKWYGPGKSNAGAHFIAPFYVQTDALSTETANVVSNSQFCTDVNANTLPAVSYISPPLANSEHPKNFGNTTQTVHTGEAYVQGLLSCLFANPTLFSTTLVFVTWDDYGGFYDHVAPPTVNNQALGIRVPLIAIGPYAKVGIFHSQLDFRSELLCMEQVFGMAVMGTEGSVTSACASDGSAMVNLSQAPISAPSPTPVPSLFAKEQHDTPDVLDAMAWAWNRLHRKHDSDDLPVIALKKRECAPETPLRNWATFKPTGEWMEFCHNRDNSLILLPGQVAGDDDERDNDDKPKSKHKKWMHIGVKVGVSWGVGKLVDDSIETRVGAGSARWTGLAVGGTVCLITRCWK